MKTTRGKAGGFIRLTHVTMDGHAMIGIESATSERAREALRSLPGMFWSDRYQRFVLPNHRENLTLLLAALRGIAWVDTSVFPQQAIEQPSQWQRLPGFYSHPPCHTRAACVP